jgi:hypothetical protein
VCPSPTAVAPVQQSQEDKNWVRVSSSDGQQSFYVNKVTNETRKVTLAPMQVEQQYATASTNRNLSSKLDNRKVRWGLIACGILVVMVVIIVAIVVALGGQGGGGGGEQQRTVKVFGTVSDSTTFNSISSVEVSVGGHTTLTDENGRYSIQFQSLEESVVLSVAATTFHAPQYAFLNLSGVFSNRTFSINRAVTVVAFTKKVNFTTGGGFSFNFNNGYGGTGGCEVFTSSISITNPIPLVFRFAIIPPSNGPGLLQSSSPGNFSNSTALQSSGLYYWDVVRASNGATASLQSDQEPIFTSGDATYSEDVDPETTDDLNFWNMDPTTGVWSDPVVIGPTRRLSEIPDGEVSRRLLDSATARARSAGFWNCDRNTRTSCVYGILETPGGLPCEGTLVQTTGGSNSNGMYSSDITNSNGIFCLEGMAGGNMGIFVGNTRVRSGKFPTTPGMCSNGQCTDLGVVMVTDATACGNYDGGCVEECLPGHTCISGECVSDGSLSFTLIWTNPQDLDLHVTPPCGIEIDYLNPSACGGFLDFDDLVGTGPENIFWNSSTPYTPGTYSVCVVYIDSGSNSFSLTVKKGGSTIHSKTGSADTCFTFFIQ